MTTKNVGGNIIQVPFAILRLDRRNPRLPESMRSTDDDAHDYEGDRALDLFEFIEAEYDPLTLARSIADHGYFVSEPMIVVQRGDVYVVVEGNRRLTALAGLISSEIRERFADRDVWTALAENAELPQTYPALLVDDRYRVAPIIGYRHISGIEPWDPHARARFVAELLDDPEHRTTVQETAMLVGEDVGQVRAMYRNWSTVQQAGDDFGLPVERVRNSFGVFTRAMTSTPIRDYIGAPAPAEVVIGQKPLNDGKVGETKDLISWLFGDEENSPVISDSRQLTKLGTAISTSDGQAELKRSRDLDRAFDAAGGPLRKVVNKLTQARNALRNVTEDFTDDLAHSDDVQLLLAECSDLVSSLLEIANA